MSTKFGQDYVKRRKKYQDLQKLRGASIYSDRDLLQAKMCIGLRKIMTFQKGKQRWTV